MSYNIYEKLLIKIEKLESKLTNNRNLFIKEFSLNNINKIIKYLDIKNSIIFIIIIFHTSKIVFRTYYLDFIYN